MEYEKIFIEAIDKGQIVNYLRGEWPYEIERSQYSSDVEPTDINRVIMRAVYESYKLRPEVKNIFQNALVKMLCGSVEDVYTAILYFDACLFAEKQNRAEFSLDINKLLPEIRKAIRQNKENLASEMEFPNGLVKKNAWNNIMYFNSNYIDEYGFDIIN